MNPSIREAALVVTVVAAIAVCIFGYIAATESEGKRQIKASFAASMIFCLWLFLCSLAWFVYDKTRPIFQLDGTIESVQILSSDSRHYSAYFRVQTKDGGVITVHASDRSDRLQSNQIVKVRYRGDTGELIKAIFYSSDGKQEGVLQSSMILEQVSGMLVGAYLIWVTIGKYRRRLSSLPNLDLHQ